MILIVVYDWPGWSLAYTGGTPCCRETRTCYRVCSDLLASVVPPSIVCKSDLLYTEGPFVSALFLNILSRHIVVIRESCMEQS